MKKKEKQKEQGNILWRILKSKLFWELILALLGIWIVAREFGWLP